MTHKCTHTNTLVCSRKQAQHTYLLCYVHMKHTYKPTFPYTHIHKRANNTHACLHMPNRSLLCTCTHHTHVHTHTNITYTQVHSASFSNETWQNVPCPREARPPWSRSRYYLPGTEKTSLSAPGTQANRCCLTGGPQRAPPPCDGVETQAVPLEQPAVLQRPISSLGAP